MERAAEKVYVAIGNDVQEGLATLEWTLRKWSSSQFSIVILHADINKDYVYTYYGKIPASYVNDQSVDFLKKCEQGKLNKILRQYIAFCGQVKTEILNIEKCDEPIHKRIVQLVSGLGICKLVMGITFLKSSSWKYGNLLSGLKHIQQKKPDFCELYLISGGKLFLLKDENNEGFIEDDQGAKLNKKRGSFRGWIGKMFPENVKSPRFSPSSTSVDSPSIWEKCAEEIEGYFNHLVEESESGQVSDEILESNRSTSIPRNLTPTQKTEFLRVKIGEARDAIHLKRREAKESVQRYSRAEWAINLCTSRSEDLEARLNEETMKRGALEKDLETIREELSETRIRLDQNRNKLDSTLEIQRELSRKLKSSTMVKSQSQEQLGKMINTRGGMIQDIEKLRKQKNVMQRRIEFCRDKDAIEMVTRLNNFGFSYKEFTAEEIRAGTDHFSEHCRIKCSGDFTNVYRARIDHTTVAVKLYDFRIRQVSEEEFDTKPRPMVHGNLNLGKILLDRNHVAKVNGFRLDFSFDESDIRSDIQDFGSLVLQLLTERNWCGFLDEVNMMNEATLVEVLDQRVGEWPLQVAMELARIAIRCSSSGDGAYTGMTMVMKEMEEVRKKADDVVAGVGCSVNEWILVRAERHKAMARNEPQYITVDKLRPRTQTPYS
ncbi:Protein kinase-like domain-containing protein [Cynara cardunculus var. scolymus]|uniref:RING-type E3 ubiquitin transferase n=1 Tax=Cynara cardunculus var. scolymus TaxID=59895 RepID=A0A103YGH3_CYNCS|nr:Protein kinase-like domain-containing protein [Cynara cardunculus var. scolymus]